MRLLQNRAWALALVAGLAASTGCNDFLEVTNPNELEADAIDPERDGPLLSQSVYQDFITQWGDIPLYVAWFTNEARVGDTFPTRNSVGRRDVQGGNSHLNGIWSDIHGVIQFAREVAAAIEPAGNSIHLARTWFASGYMILLQAELFCQGTIAESKTVPRGPMDTGMLLDSAIADLTKAKTIAEAVAGDTAAASLAMAAQVGIARAHLQAGRPQQAAAAAAVVPDDFVFHLWHLDDSANRNLANNLWVFSFDRISLVVGPEYRIMADSGDTRISYVDMGRVAQDGVLQFHRQDKYETHGDHERFASGLEARYIEVEANQSAAEMEAFINERRAVGNQAPIATTTDLNVLMTELMEQKTRDFWLEGKRLGDWRRNPQFVPYIIPAGDTYYKTGLGPVRDFSCWDVPQAEINNNPNW
ncbi:MAG TPA: hypothetical protein VFZ24_18295 [Longimicrobiales bacterium]